MDKSQLNKELIEFINSDKVYVYALKGDWGVGKTYYWNNFLIENNKKLNLRKYSYISLFGVKNLSELKRNLFERCINLDETDSLKKEIINVFTDNFNRLKEYWDNLKILQDAKKGITFLNYYLLRDTQGFKEFTDAAAFYVIKDTIICFDDLERKHDDLTINEIFGIASILREQRNCKILFIFNKENINNEDKIKLESYQEKLIDREFLYDPSIEDVINIVFSEDYENYQVILESCRQLKIRNIRTLKRFRHFIDSILSIIGEKENITIHSVIKAVILLVWSYDNKLDDTPTLGFIRSLSYSQFYFDEVFNDNNQNNNPTKEQIEKEKREKKWKELLQNYDFVTDEVDLLICDYIETGYIDVAKLNKLLNLSDENIRAHNIRGSLTKVWKKYFHSNFKNNSEEFLDELKAVFNSGSKYLGINDLNDVLIMMRRLGSNDMADKLITNYISSHHDNEEKFDLNATPFGPKELDKKLSEELYKHNNNIKDNLTLSTVLSKMVNSDGWNIAEEEFLASRTAEEYYSFFNTEDNENLSRYIKKCLEFGRYQPPSENHKKIYNNSREALLSLENKSDFNKIRLERFHLEVDLLAQYRNQNTA